MRVRLRHLRPTRPLASVDCETTGVDPATARVVEVGRLRRAVRADKSVRVSVGR